MRLRLKPDPKRKQKYAQAYYLANRAKLIERNRRRIADPTRRARRDFLLPLRERTEEILAMRVPGRFDLAASRARAERFEQINALRERGLSYVAIDKHLGDYDSKRPNARSQWFMACAQKSWNKGHAAGRAWADSHDGALVRTVHRFMTGQGVSFQRLQDALEHDGEY